MKAGNSLIHKIMEPTALQQQVARWRLLGKKIAFTNGCFDILHAGHIASLSEAANQADVLIVGVNADASVRGLKGDNRPVNNEENRALVLASLMMVDGVIVFNEDTPRDLILSIKPDVLVKGGDYKIEEIAGGKEVLAWGGKVFLNPIVPGLSTTNIIKLLQQGGNKT